MQLMLGAEREAGYTLTEMLAALFILSLAMGGTLQAGFLLERQQRATISQVRNLDAGRDISNRFEALLAGYRPSAGGADLEGDSQGFSFPCASKTCEARLAADASELRVDGAHPAILQLSGLHHPHFVYLSQGVESDSWPVTSTRPEPLQAVVLLDDGHEGEGVVLTARLWREEARGCRFDVISRACRGSPP